ncbi:uncharacterized protein, YkwD family [Seinonella peptonophila]|uniref:Uncharacterized protein, YkwD family n=1 Tax=Seinonella peptonophila TaxID=112248 RepID=A0A1M4SNI5_9BACL|nr:CAP domain-containing protein [Seinonella peptonophila]SHE33722.1 uncharacterized protein, YkwD family [Seinonella peptonophila]
MHQSELHRRRSLFSASVVFLTLLFVFQFQQSVFASKYPIPKNHQLNEYEKEVIRLVNEERKKNGLKPLKTHQDLSFVARKKSADMCDNNYFNHDSPTYGSPEQMVNDHGISYYHGVGENIAEGYQTPAETINAWMNSEGHRRNILDPDYTHIGVGYVDGGGTYGTYWTQQFIGIP